VSDRRAVLRPAEPEDGPVIADIYLRSFRATLPDIRLTHGDADVRDHFATVVTNDLVTWVACEGDAVVGFIALTDDDHVGHLYLRPGHTGRGIGAELLARAKELRPSGLWLYVFQANTGARRFYERHGFTVVDLDDGARNDEGEPDVLYLWRPAAPT
jgi:ribosomal protein S18 acetylase RimI-like enzyme